MNRRNRSFVAVLLAGVCLVTAVGTTPAVAADPTVHDTAEFFDISTLDRVNATVRQIKQQYGKDLTIETFPVVPLSMHSRMTTESKETFFENWLRDEARKAETNGVFILIVKNPGRVQVGVGRSSHQWLPDKERDELKNLIVARFQEKKFDQGLIDAANYVQQKFAENHGGKIPVQVPSPELSPSSAPPVPTTQPSTKPTTDSATNPSAAPTSAPTTQPASSSTGELEVKPAPSVGDANK